MFPFILRWGARYRVSWKNIIVYSSQNGCVISGNHPVTLWLNDAAVMWSVTKNETTCGVFFFQSTFCNIFQVMFLICNWRVPLIFLSSEPNEYECKPCLGIFTCLSQIGYQHSWPVKKRGKRSTQEGAWPDWLKRGRRPPHTKADSVLDIKLTFPLHVEL